MQITANIGKIFKNVQGDLNFISKIHRKFHRIQITVIAKKIMVPNSITNPDTSAV